jgi:hypothetical protein
MNKNQLRTIISEQLVAGQTIQVTLRNLDGDFTVVNKRCGRGKGGSWLADLQHIGTSEEVTIGTPRHNEVLNITVGGTFYGSNDFEGLPPSYEPDAVRAAELKTQTRGLVEAVGTRVRITAPTAPEVDGVFTVTGGRTLRGRGGQVVLALDGANGRTSFWSHRHSGVVTAFEIL